MNPMDQLWAKFLGSLGMDPSGNSPLPQGTDPIQFYRQWENFLLNSQLTTPGTPTGTPMGTMGTPMGTTATTISSGEQTLDATRGVVFYEDGQYQGQAWGPFTEGDYSWVADHGVANDSMSSVKLPPGWTVYVYADANFKGHKWVHKVSTAYVGNEENDKMSSFKIRGPGRAEGWRNR